MGVAFLAVFLAAEIPLFSQARPYPGSRRGNYPMGGLGVPMPDLPEVNFKGKLKKIDGKVILLDLDDGRTASFQRSGKTKFYKDSKEIKPSDLHIGDRISLDAKEDPRAFLDALKVTFDNSPAVADAHGRYPGESAESPLAGIQYDENGRPTLRKRSSEESPDLAGSAPPSVSPPLFGDNVPTLKRRPPAESQESAGSDPPADSPPRDVDNGPPTLRKRNPAEPEHTESQEPGSAGPSSGGRSDASPPQDLLIEKARAAAVSSPGKLPNFICQEVMARSSRDANGSSWQPIDVVSTEVINKDGQESHRNFRVNDQPTDKENMSGSWPIGKLVSTLSDLLSPDTRTQFRFGGDTNLPNLQARVYDYDVARENSQWIMRMESQAISAAYGGTVYIDKESGRVMRLEMQAHDLPEGFPMDRLETDVEYAFVRVGEVSRLLPVHVETMGCQRATHACSRSVIDFRNYRQYTGN